MESQSAPLSLASELCLACGLCCEGTLYTKALIGKRCSVGTLRSLGAWLNWGDGRAPRYDRIGHP
ncbi:hypothetical protein, partial [Novosphingobium sp. B1]|uniref:hypothetical protein n=1 Tax=Novosphingobium sp. B1 TaxID=1938756 RepID=UPI0009D88438